MMGYRVPMCVWVVMDLQDQFANQGIANLMGGFSSYVGGNNYNLKPSLLDLCTRVRGRICLFIVVWVTFLKERGWENQGLIRVCLGAWRSVVGEGHELSRMPLLCICVRC